MPRTKPRAEARRFGMHPKLLMDVIRRQAGSLAKAILEGVMNAVDAGAAECAITLTPERLTIVDDGAGMTERRQIEEYFETFGRPHDESERKRYGTFRMGRGQLFAYGRNRWRTGPFGMDVDIEHQGLDYTLKADLDPQLGCRVEVELYNPLLPSERAETARTVRHWVRYAPIAVTWDGERISADPAGEKWDAVTDEAYVRLSSAVGPLALYNLGVHTMDLPGGRYGTGGVVVSRQPLKVNFARNDVQSDCPVWAKIRPLVDRMATDRNTRKPTLTDAEQQRLIDQLVRSELPWSRAAEARLITLVTGRRIPAKDLLWSSLPVSQCPQHHPIGDRLHQRRVALILDEATCAQFEVADAGALARLLRDRAGLTVGEAPRYIPFAELAAGLSERYDLVDEDRWTPNERILVQIAAVAAPALAWPSRQFAGDDRLIAAARRRMLVGVTDSASAWTDGQRYVAFDRRFLRSLDFSVAGLGRLGRVLLHELCHDGPSSGTHAHSPEFYERFHDAADGLGAVIERALIQLPSAAEFVGRTLNRQALKAQDRVEKARRAGRDLDRRVAAARAMLAPLIATETEAAPTPTPKSGTPKRRRPAAARA